MRHACMLGCSILIWDFQWCTIQQHFPATWGANKIMWRLPLSNPRCCRVCQLHSHWPASARLAAPFKGCGLRKYQWSAIACPISCFRQGRSLWAGLRLPPPPHGNVHCRLSGKPAGSESWDCTQCWLKLGCGQWHCTAAASHPGATHLAVQLSQAAALLREPVQQKQV